MSDVAKTIAQQLGKPALFMLGAHTFTKTEDTLCFKIRGSQKVNLIQITLKVDDTYTMEFWRIRGVKSKCVKTLSGVYWDMLHDLIESETGLYTSL